MGGELRHILALMGDQAVTVVAFAALLAYGMALLSANGGGIGRLAALLLIGGSAIWLLLAMTGIIRSNLANWSPAAVMLLAIGIEEKAASKARGDRRQQPQKHSDTGPHGDTPAPSSLIADGTKEAGQP